MYTFDLQNYNWPQKKNQQKRKKDLRLPSTNRYCRKSKICFCRHHFQFYSDTYQLASPTFHKLSQHPGYKSSSALLHCICWSWVLMVDRNEYWCLRGLCTTPIKTKSMWKKRKLHNVNPKGKFILSPSRTLVSSFNQRTINRNKLTKRSPIPVLTDTVVA